jgi:vacuolar-type H+-ATPase subunit I/STV1
LNYLIISSNHHVDFFPFSQVPPILPLIGQAVSANLLPNNVKALLLKMLPLLNQDIGQLVQDVEPIRNIFKQIQSQLPRDLKEKVLQVAFIENRQLQVQEAQDQLQERKHQEQLTQDRENLDNSIADLDIRIELLSSSHSEIVHNIDRLKHRQAELMKELDQIEQDMAME